MYTIFAVIVITKEKKSSNRKLQPAARKIAHPYRQLHGVVHEPVLYNLYSHVRTTHSAIDHATIIAALAMKLKLPDINKARLIS